jgi:hypothetical protein
MVGTPIFTDLIASGLFGLAVAHTFSTKLFERIAHAGTRHAGLWRLLGEVEVVFGFWAAILIAYLCWARGVAPTIDYLNSRNFTEPAFVFVIMVVAASRPVLFAAERLLVWLAAALPLPRRVGFYVVTLSVGPLLGSFITEPAAMTLTALVLRDRYFAHARSEVFKYATIGTLFVNVSIGGTLTPFAAPPVLMVAGTWGWDTAFMIQTFGWRAALAVLVNATALTLLFRRQILDAPAEADSAGSTVGAPPPGAVTLVHLLFLLGVVVFAHYPVVFLGLFLFFLGFTEAYSRHQSPLILREGLMVGFFLAGLIVLGGQQQWWLSTVLRGLDDQALYFGATALTAITDNAALTYLGSLVDGVDDGFKYALVAGAVTGGGLTVIANAPNPAGYSLLKGTFRDEAIGALGLFAAAVPPTLVAIVAFWGDRLLPAAHLARLAGLVAG